MSKERFWKTKEGKIIKISEMSTSHIKNCILMLRKNKFIGKAELESFFSVNYDMMGDGAQYAFDQPESRIREKK